ncbi:hypothetical protein GOZ83_20080 [Agrobacterium vitis]|uniref:hypothetical protein n=1 Tax=Agrobacterium vitis TaxID=373 RepID=UPI0012E73C96|nr:hypothetical protein [Agrobacterium vitis]MVA47357.1 hypothetical protein [Agrobacterium vitis]
MTENKPGNSTPPLETHANGDIKTAPLVGYETHILAGMACLLRIGFVTSEQALKTMSLSYNQLVLTPEQCRQLSATLLRAAEKIEAQSIPSVVL